MCREKLSSLVNKEPNTYVGTFIRYGKGKAHTRPLLLENIHDVCGEFLTDHSWIRECRVFERFNLRKGDRIQFDATIISYVKRSGSGVDYGFSDIYRTRTLSHLNDKNYLKEYLDSQVGDGTDFRFETTPSFYKTEPPSVSTADVVSIQPNRANSDIEKIIQLANTYFASHSTVKRVQGHCLKLFFDGKIQYDTFAKEVIKKYCAVTMESRLYVNPYYKEVESTVGEIVHG